MIRNLALIKNLALVLLLSSTSAFSSVSTSQAQTSPQPTPSAAPATAPTSTGSSTIPSGTVVTVASPQSGLIKVGKDGGTEVQLAIAKDVTVGGKVAIPVGTTVLGTVQEKDGGAKFIITQILVNDRLTPFNATSIQKLVSEKVSKDQFSSNDLTRQRIEGSVTNTAANVGNNLGNNLGGGIGGNILSTAGGIAATSLFSGGKVRVVNIAAGQPYLLTLDSAAKVDASTSPAGVAQPQQQPGFPTRLGRL